MNFLKPCTNKGKKGAKWLNARRYVCRHAGLRGEVPCLAAGMDEYLVAGSVGCMVGCMVAYIMVSMVAWMEACSATFGLPVPKLDHINDL
jgi:hypothetical protein